jgi:hypothetical protein
MINWPYIDILPSGKSFLIRPFVQSKSLKKGAEVLPAGMREIEKTYIPIKQPMEETGNKTPGII